MSFEECKKIAISGLRECYGPNGFYAGLHQFKDYWSRDSMWTCLGALELNDIQIVKKNLQTFLKFEKDGFIPLRVGNKFIFQTFLGLKSKKEYPKYHEHQSNSISTDSNTLLIVALYHYVLKTNDLSFFKKHQEKIEKILSKILEFTNKNNLVQENYYSTWMDGLKKRGKIFYSNLLFYLAVKYYINLSNKLRTKSEQFTDKFLKDLEKSIRKTFWNGKYFSDWIGNNDKDYLDTFANLIAIYFDFATKNEKDSIFKFIKQNNIIRKDGTILKSYPDYSSKYISPFLKLIGLRGYCSIITYPWMSFFYFLCLQKEKKITKQDKNDIQNLCDIILRDRTVHECYTFKQKPYKTLWYTSEHPFAWACSFAVLLLNK